MWSDLATHRELLPLRASASRRDRMRHLEARVASRTPAASWLGDASRTRCCASETRPFSDLGRLLESFVVDDSRRIARPPSPPVLEGMEGPEARRRNGPGHRGLTSWNSAAGAGRKTNRTARSLVYKAHRHDEAQAGAPPGKDVSTCPRRLPGQQQFPVRTRCLKKRVIRRSRSPRFARSSRRRGHPARPGGARRRAAQTRGLHETRPWMIQRRILRTPRRRATGPSLLFPVGASVWGRDGKPLSPRGPLCRPR